MKRIELPGENHENWFVPTIYHATDISDLLDPTSREYAFDQAQERYQAKLAAKAHAPRSQQLVSTLIRHPWNPNHVELTPRGKEEFRNAAGFVVIPRVSHIPLEDTTGSGYIRLQEDRSAQIDVETLGGPYNPLGSWMIVQYLRYCGFQIPNPTDLKALDWTANAVLISRFTESLETGESSDTHILVTIDNDHIKRKPVLTELGKLIQQGLFGLQPQTNESVR